MGMMEKPIVVERIHGFVRNVRKNGNKIGHIPRQMILDYDNTCNFNCSFCYELQDRKYNGTHLTLDEISDLADQAYEMGIWEIILQGGELLVRFDEFLDVIKAFKPERFRMILITNGYLLTKERAKILKDAGLDCVGVSVSTLDAEIHNAERGGIKDAHKKAIEAFDNAKEAGLTVWAQMIFGHHNSRSDELFEMLDYLKEKDIGVYFLLAMPYGDWKDNLLDAEDLRIFNKIRKDYNCVFDTWDFYDKDKERITGCWAGNRPFITPKGDVLPCPFINISLGNIREQSLKEIFDYTMTIKYFGEYSPICLSAQNRSFRKDYLDGLEMSMFHPADAHKVFKKEDYIDE